MSIKDKLLSDRRQTRCGVRAFMSTLERPEKIEFLEALNEPRISAPALSAHMGENHEDAPSVWMIKAHRRGECSCDDHQRTVTG